MDPIHEHRAQAKRLAELAGLSDHPWTNADKQLKAAIAEEKRREAEEAERAERDEAQRFHNTLADYRRIIGDIRQKRTEIAEKEGEIGELPADTQRNMQILQQWLSSPAGYIWRQEYKLGATPVGAAVNVADQPRGALPGSFTWSQVDAAERFRQVTDQINCLRQAEGNMKASLENHEKQFPALRDIREAEGI